MATTPHRDLPYPELDELADVPAWLSDLALALDADTPFSMGPLVDRPVSTPVSPGVSGRWYYATDRPGVIDFDTGTSWSTIGEPDDITLGKMPQVGVYRNAAMDIGAAYSAISWDAERYESNTPADSMHSTAVNPTRLIVPQTGLYMCHVHVAQRIIAAAARSTIVGIALNGVTVSRGENNADGSAPNAPYNVQASFIRRLTTGDYLEAYVASTSAGGPWALSVGPTGTNFAAGDTPTEATLTMLSR